MADHHTHTSKVSPASAALPNEILSHIFIHSAQLFGTVYLPFKFQKQQTFKPIQIVISHVSSPWRQVALDTHELWTDVSIDLREVPASDGIIPIDTVNERWQVVSWWQTWLSRAGRHRPVRLALGFIPNLRSMFERQTSAGSGSGTGEIADVFWKVVSGNDDDWHVRVGHLKLKILLSQLS